MRSFKSQVIIFALVRVQIAIITVIKIEITKVAIVTAIERINMNSNPNSIGTVFIVSIRYGRITIAYKAIISAVSKGKRKRS
ncbi:hypothetical protein [Clostridium estertheticum]|uniref:hypothetical protein n=1 Tax=Clostridium estertheticum TaxID=238834 RepID=UPI00209B85DB|nr:hypothetical protein [Clostridium estertheticum]